MFRLTGRVLRYLSLTLLTSLLAWAQVSTSRIEGTVTDKTNALVAGASVKITSEATGITYETKTSSSGTFAVPSLTPGQYTVRVTQPGFETFVSQHNVLSVGQPLVVNATLAVGVTTQVVEVASSYQRLETTNPTISDVITTEQVTTLPLNGRNPLNLLTLEPGVTQRPTGASGSGTHVFGSRDRAHNVTIDGIDANESTVPNPQTNLQRLNPDNVQEYRTITLDATAEQGRNSGANVMIATKPGSNAFHGDIFYFNRNTAYNANEWFNNYTNQKRPVLNLHQFGFDVGGPIIKNKTFFFGSYQGNNIKQTEPIAATGVGVAGFGAPTTYTALARQGIFRFVRGTINVNGTNVTQNSPLLVDANGNLLAGVPVCNGTTVTGNCVGSYNIFSNDPMGIGPDSMVAGLLGKTPLPNDFGLGDALNTGGFDWTPPSAFKGPNVLVRIDHNINENNNIFGRFLIGSYNTSQGDFLNSRPQVYPGGFPPLGEVNRDNANLAVSYRHTFTPTLVNELTAGFNRFKFLFTFGESNPGFGDPTKDPPWADDCVANSTLNVDSPFCGSAHTARGITAPQILDNVSWIHGAHNLRFGINFRFYLHNDSRGFFGGNIASPIVLFRRTVRTAGLLNVPGGSGASKPSSVDIRTIQQAAVELMGVAGQIQQAFPADFVHDVYGHGLETVYTRAHQYDSYIQDEWHVRPNLTINAGVRWEYNPPPFDAKQSHVPNGNIGAGPVSYVKADSWYKNDNRTAVGPRFGIAYSPDSKTSIRAGYGWMFDTISTFQVTAQAGKVPGFALNCVNRISLTGVMTTTAGCVTPPGMQNRIAGGFPLSVPAPATSPSLALSQPAYQVNGVAPSVGAFDPNLKNPSIHEWNLTIQRELPAGFVAEVGYVGKRGTHLYRAYDLNQINFKPEFINSFLIARQNAMNGCNPSGIANAACPGGGPSPALLISLLGGCTATNCLLDNNVTDFLQNNVGDLATQIDQTNITVNGFPGNYFRPNPQFTQIFFQGSSADSYYHGAFAEVRRRFEQGLSFGLSYTFSRSIDNASIDPVGAATGGGLSTTNSVTPTDIHNFRLDRARSDFDNRHVLSMNMVYEFPFGQGKRFASGVANWLNHVIGGWSYTGIFNYQSGEPYTIYSGSQTANTEHVSTALVRGPLDTGHLQFVPGIEGPVMYNTGPLITNPLDPNFDCRNVIGTQTFFCIPPPGQQGSGRNLVQGPSFWNLDSGMGKNFQLTERFKLQFRVEAFNVLNHPNFNNPRNASSGSPRVTSSLFGRTCCSTAALPSSATVIAIGEPNRVLQLGMKVSF